MQEQEEQRDQDDNAPSAEAIILIHGFPSFLGGMKFDRRFRAVSLADLADELADRLVFVRLEPRLKAWLRGQEAKHHLRALPLQRRLRCLQQTVQQLVSPAVSAHQGHNRILH